MGAKFAIIFGDDQDADGVFAGGGQDFLSDESVADGDAVVGPEEVGSAFHAGPKRSDAHAAASARSLPFMARLTSDSSSEFRNERFIAKRRS